MSSPHSSAHAAAPTKPVSLAGYVGIVRGARRAAALVWSTQPLLTIGLLATSLVSGLLPSAIAWVGGRVIDAIVHATAHATAQATVSGTNRDVVLRWVVIELGLVVALAAAARIAALLRSLLRQQLGHRVNVDILEKALTLDITQFEDAELYDKMTRARREASARPLSLVTQTLDLLQNIMTLLGLAALLWAFSPWALLVLAGAAMPSFLAELKFSKDAFRLASWRTPETREQVYLETIIAREDHAKEVKLFGVGARFLDRYRDIFVRLYAQDRALAVRRGLWGIALGTVGTAVFYTMVGWIAWRTLDGVVTLGAMTMYVAAFRGAQGALAGGLGAASGMYEDNLYLANLHEFLQTPALVRPGHATVGPAPQDGIRFEDVSFVYPGSETPAIDHVTLHVPKGSKLAIVGENGSGKTTLIKLLARLYEPTSGRVLLDGIDVREWSQAALHRRIGVIFQDFARYQFTVGENIGAGDNDAYHDETRWHAAAEKGLAAPLIAELPDGFQTRLGKWFHKGRELSLGQWQKIALSRAFMREHADILVLDEPTASMDADAEVKVFERFREVTADKIAIVISHRFSTVRMADQIVVLDKGRITERGTHQELVGADGRYATLFRLQAAGYL